MESAQPIIVKKIKKGGHAHHGGAWKVAFADFVTAMMAFFLLLWLLASTTPEQKSAISNYFQNPSAIVGPGGASSSMVKFGAEDAEKVSGKTEHTQDQQGEGESVEQKIKTNPVELDRDAKQEAKRLDTLKHDLEATIEASQALIPFKDQLLLDITSEGLRIQIIDKENRPMFASGRSDLKDYTKVILHEIAKLIKKVPNKISLTGHTDAKPFTSMRGYTNWELSADRANASRRTLVEGGLPADKIAKVVGLSSTVLFDKAHPESPINRRISLIVMNKQTEDKMIDEAGALAGLTASQRPSQLATQLATAPIALPSTLPPAVKQLPTFGRLAIPKIGPPVQLGKPITTPKTQLSLKPKPSSKPQLLPSKSDKDLKIQTF